MWRLFIFFVFDILLSIFCHFDILHSIFCNFDILRSIFCLSIFCLLDALSLRYFATSIYCVWCFATSIFSSFIFCFRYFVRRCFAYSIFYDSVLCIFDISRLDILRFDILHFRYLTPSIFLRFWYFATSIFCFSISRVRYVVFQYLAMEAPYTHIMQSCLNWLLKFICTIISADCILQGVYST